MASQMYSTTGKRKMKRNQSSELDARLRMLPTILAAEQDREQLAIQNKFQNKQLDQEKSLAKKGSRFQKQQSKQALGLEVGKMGINLASSDLFKGKSDPGITPGVDPQQKITPAAGSSNPGYFSGLTMGGGITGGMGGYGAASMFGGSKKKKLLIGAGAGALTGMLGGGNGISGALGGLFGGMIA